MSSPVLSLKGLTRSWEPGNPVFSKLDLEISDGDVTVLVGPSGCGKSTLLRCAASLDSPDDGTVQVRGEEVKEPDPRRQLILQSDNQLFPWLTVGENIRFACRRMEGRPDEPGVEGILDSVGLPGTEDTYPAKLSGGMRQRAVLARALAVGPEILLLDEPFAALDTVVRSRLQQLLVRLNREQGTSMLLVTHDVSEALVLGDSLVYMDSGGVLSQHEENPLGADRNPDSPEFHRETIRMRRRYRDLLDSID